MCAPQYANKKERIIAFVDASHKKSPHLRAFLLDFSAVYRAIEVTL